MRQAPFSLISAVLVALLAAAAGCRPQQPPEPDRLAPQVTRDFFQSLGTGDTRGAEVACQRLQDLFPDQPFFATVRRENLLGVRLQTVNRLLAAGKVAEADRILRATRDEAGSTPELARALDLATGLQAILQYREQGTFTSADDLERTLAPVLARRESLQKSPAFTAWLARQQEVLAGLHQRELHALFAQLVRDFDRHTLAGDEEAARLLRQITAIKTDDPLLEQARRHLAAKPAETAAFAANAEAVEAALRVDESAPALEIALVRAWPRLDAALRDQLALRTLPPEPATVSGLLLRARLALVRGNRVQAAAWAGRLLREQPQLNSELTAEGLTALVLPQDGFQAEAWQKPFPTVPDLLRRLSQLRQPPPAPAKGQD